MNITIMYLLNATFFFKELSSTENPMHNLKGSIL